MPAPLTLILAVTMRPSRYNRLRYFGHDRKNWNLTPTPMSVCCAALRLVSPAGDVKGLRGDGWRDTGI